MNDTAGALSRGEISPADFPPIRLVERGGEMVTLDNRRLVAFQKAGVSKVPYVMATAEEMAKDAFKFTSKTGGRSIRIRGIEEIWGG